jgi:hypothetical protein
MNHDRKKQYIVLVSKHWSSSRAFKKEFTQWQQYYTSRFQQTAASPSLSRRDPLSYYNLSDSAQQIFQAIASNGGAHLKKDYSTIITGYSVFSAVALHLAVLLRNASFCVQKVVTFAQPIVFSPLPPLPTATTLTTLTTAATASGRDPADHITLIRVLDSRDPVNMLFPYVTNTHNDTNSSVDTNDSASLPWQHYQFREIILLNDKYHTSNPSFLLGCGLDSPDKLQSSSTGVFSSNITQLLQYNEGLLNDHAEFHALDSYLQRIHSKVRDSTLISFQERHKY